MNMINRFAVFILVGVSLMIFAAGCSESEPPQTDNYIIRTLHETVSVEDFSEELDLKRAAYSYNIAEDPSEYNQMVVDLIQVLSEEIILLSAAKEQRIEVTQEELETAVEKFKGEYPDNSFEKILLENAIPFPLWQKRFHRNMIMDKLIETQLRKKIEITAADIVGFYKQHQAAGPAGEDGKSQVLDNIETEKELVARLRMQKTQEQYGPWLAALEERYPVEINKEKLKHFFILQEKDEDVQNEK